MYPNSGKQTTAPDQFSSGSTPELRPFAPIRRAVIMEPPEVSQWGPIIRAHYNTPRPYTSWCLLLSVPFTGGRSWFDLRFKKFDR